MWCCIFEPLTGTTSILQPNRTAFPTTPSPPTMFFHIFPISIGGLVLVTWGLPSFQSFLPHSMKRLNPGGGLWNCYAGQRQRADARIDTSLTICSNRNK